MPDRYGNPTNEEIKAMQAKTTASVRAARAAQIAAAAPEKAAARKRLQELEASRRRKEIERNKQLAIEESRKRNLDRRRAEARAAQPRWRDQSSAHAAIPPVAGATADALKPTGVSGFPGQPSVKPNYEWPLDQPEDFGYDPDRPSPYPQPGTPVGPQDTRPDLPQTDPAGTPKQKPPMTAEDLAIARDKALLAAKEAQQKLNNPNVPTPSNVQAEQERLSNFQTEMEQQGTLGGGVSRMMPGGAAAVPGPTGRTPTEDALAEQRAAMQERLRQAMAEAQQQKALGGGIDRGMPAQGGKKFPGDPSDIQGIPVADATRDALRKPPGVSGFPGQAQESYAAQPARRPIGSAVDEEEAIQARNVGAPRGGMPTPADVNNQVNARLLSLYNSQDTRGPRSFVDGVMNRSGFNSTAVLGTLERMKEEGINIQRLGDDDVIARMIATTNGVYRPEVEAAIKGAGLLIDRPGAPDSRRIAQAVARLVEQGIPITVESLRDSLERMGPLHEDRGWKPLGTEAAHTNLAFI